MSDPKFSSITPVYRMLRDEPAPGDTTRAFEKAKDAPKQEAQTTNHDQEEHAPKLSLPDPHPSFALPPREPEQEEQLSREDFLRHRKPKDQSLKRAFTRGVSRG